MEIHKYVKQDTAVDMDMTPMIDIVFLLIIFFMVVTELSNLDIVELVLPVADKAIVEDPAPGSRTVVVNIRPKPGVDAEKRTGELVLGGVVRTPEELGKQLGTEAVIFDKWEPNPNDHTKKDSLLEINLRADEGVTAGHIHEVYKACQGAKIFKVRLAALNLRLEDPYSEDE